MAFDFFATDDAREAVRLKVEALYPAHEVERFTELFWSRIQRWRDEEGSTTVNAAAMAVAAPTPASSTSPARRAPRGRRPTRTA